MTAGDKMKAKADQIRIQIALVAAALVLVISGLTVSFAQNSWKQSGERANDVAHDLVQLLERQIGQTFTQVDVSLQTVAMEVQREMEHAGGARSTQITALLAKQQEWLPEVDFYLATDAQGTVRYGLGIPRDAAVNIENRDYFRQLRDDPKAGSVVFGPLRNRISQHWTIGLARALHGPDGAFAGVLLATLPVDRFQAVLSTLNLGRNGSASLRKSDSALIAMVPAAPDDGPLAVGSRVVSPERLTHIAANPISGTFTAVTAADQIERTNLYMQIGQYPMYVTVAFASEDTRAEWRRVFAGNLSLAVIAVVVTVLAAALLARAWKTQQQTSDQIGQSEERFRTLFENNLCIMLVIDPADGRLVDANQAASNFYGHSVQTLRAMKIDAINTMAPDKVALACAAAARQTHNVFHFKHRLASGEIRDVEVYSTPVKVNDATLLFSIIHDISNRTRSEAALRDSESRYARVIDGSDQGFWEWNMVTAEVTVSPRFESMLGYAPGEWAQARDNHWSPIAADDVAAAKAALRSHLAGLTPLIDTEFRTRTKTGGWRWIQARGKVVTRGEDGRPLLLAGTHTDITEHKSIEVALKTMNKDFVALLESSSDFIYFKDKDSRFRYCSQTMADVTGHKSWRDMIGKHDRDVFPAEVAEIYYREEFPIFNDGIALLNKIGPHFKQDGTPGWISTNKWPMFDDDGKTVIGIFGISRDVTQTVLRENELREMATTDFLTGVATRRDFIGAARHELDIMQRNPSHCCALLMLDLDHFKKINDTFGHAAGDAVLQHVTRLATREIRRVDRIGRLGGEEFAILMPGTDMAGACNFAERLRQTVADTPLEFAGHSISVTVSIGLSALLSSDTSPEQAVARADKAMYQAKNAGRNRVETDETVS